MQMSNMDCLQFGWFKHRRMNHNNLAVYDILLHITNAADDRSEYVFRPTRNLQAMDMLDQRAWESIMLQAKL